MNLVSAILGILLLPSLGLDIEHFAEITYNSWFDWGTFNAVTIVVTWFVATLLTTVIECFVLWLLFCMPWKRRWFIVVLIANALTVALAILTAFIYLPR